MSAAERWPWSRFAAAGPVTAAALYEGYILYPYRASAAKNHCRWQFGVLAPPPAGGGPAAERTSMRAQLVAEARRSTRIAVRACWLHLQARTVEVPSPAGPRPVPRLEAGGETWVSWDEAVTDGAGCGPVALADVVASPVEVRFGRPATEDRRPLDRADAELVRRRWPLTGTLRVSAEALDGPWGLIRVGVEVENTTAGAGPFASRDEMARRSLLAAHAVVALDGGRWISPTDPPEFAAAAVGACATDGAWPVLLGEEGESDLALASPIILPDHPQVAPESTGDFFDATEIDEMLTLRVLTLTDAEREEARRTDPKAAAIIDRCEAMDPEALAGLHGTVRSMRVLAGGPPQRAEETVVVGGVRVGRGSRVRLRPGRRADAQDLFVAGRIAVVEEVLADVDGRRHLAVSVEDDPGAEELRWYGRYLYFAPEEVEPVGAAT